jgi:hypothetical protein
MRLRGGGEGGQDVSGMTGRETQQAHHANEKEKEKEKEKQDGKRDRAIPAKRCVQCPETLQVLKKSLNRALIP